MQVTDPNDTDAYFYSYMGIASALVFANLGAAFGTAKVELVYVQWELKNQKKLLNLSFQLLWLVFLVYMV